MGSKNGINKSLSKIVPAWMLRFYKDPVLSCKKKMRKAIEKNEDPSDLSAKKHPEPNNFQPSVEKIVIPRIEPDIRSTFFIFTNTSIKTEDDPVLRFIPCIPGASGFVNLAEFKDTGLLERQWPCSKRTGEGTFCNSFDVMDGLRHNEEYSKGGELLEMRRLFCNVCFIFGCKWHSKTKGICIKPVGFENNPSGSKSESKEVCGEVCKKMKRLYKSITKNDIDQSAYSVLYRDCWMSQGYGCIASLLFYFRHRRYIPCEEIKESCATLAGRHKYVIG